MQLSVEKEDVDHQIKRLERLEEAGRPIVVAGVRAHMKVGERGIASEAPVFDHDRPRVRTVRHRFVDPGGLGAAIGSRLKKYQKEIVEAKVGANVGKTQVDYGQQVRRGGKLGVPYSHLVILGTSARWTGIKGRVNKKTGRVKVTHTGNPTQFRGIGPPHHFVEEGYEKVMGEADKACLDKMEKELRRVESAA